ncbi:MAG: hypothetical protein Q7I97_00570 [Thermovirgaceae bacterium]|nr:hypothetical protein [Thermovirgaceae bacterium]
MKHRPILATMILTVMLSLCSAVHANDIAAELARSLREAPSLDAMGSGQGFVILRDIRFRLLADGRMERTSLWFLHEGGGIPDGWRNWEILVPEGGEASVLEAALYDPSSRKMQYPLIPREIEKNGVSLVEVRLPNNFEGNILALSYRQVFPTRMNIEDAVLLDLDLPQWEQRISVTVPSGTVPEWHGEGIPDPEFKKGTAQDIYTWSIVNTPALLKGVIAPESVRALVLSLKKGLRYALADAAALADSVSASPPAQVASMISGSNRTRGGERIMEYVNSPSRLLSGFQGDLVRPAINIPADGPWTEWEASFLLRNWLRRAGWSAELLWEPVIPVGDDAPATVRVWRKPVLSLTPPGGSAFMFEIGQGTRPGSTPPRLWGRTVYALEGSTVLRRAIPAGGAADHRLSFNWNLSLSPEGVASGDLVVTVRGGWVDTLSGGAIPTNEKALEILAAFGWPSTPGIPGEQVSLETLGSGFRISVPVRTQLGLPGGEGLLVRMPSVIMPWQVAIAERGASNGIRFPFVYEQSIEIALPEGFGVMVLPALRPFGSGSVRIEENLRVKKSRTLVGEHRMVVTSARLDDPAKQIFSNAVRQGLGWSGVTIPLRRR